MKVAWLLRYFPIISQTFIYREIEGFRRHQVETRAFVWEKVDAPLPPWNVGEVEELPRGWGYLSAGLAVVVQLLSRPVRTVGAIYAGLHHQRLKEVIKAVWLGSRLSAQNYRLLLVPFGSEAAELGWVAAKVAGIPWGCTLHAADLFCPRPSLPALIREVDHLIVVCHYTQQWVSSHYGRQAVVVRCGVEALPPSPCPPRLEILTVGRAVKKKGLDVCIEAARYLKNMGITFRWRVVGGGPELSTLRAEACHPEDPLFLGALGWSEVQSIYAQGVSIFVLPARVDELGDRDALPVALVEAMAQGVAVISTPVAGIPELVRPGVTGWLVPPDDAAALATQIISVWQNEAVTREVVANAQTWVRRYYRQDNLASHLLGALATVT